MYAQQTLKGMKHMIIPIIATMKMYHLLEKLKHAQDEEDAIFLSKNVDGIISEFEKLKVVAPEIKVIYDRYLEEEEDLFD